ncbi:hypothetical protein R4I06_04235 [Anaplasma bovis]
MHEVSKAINILDNPNTIDSKICKDGAYSHTGSNDVEVTEEGKCGLGQSSSGTSRTKGGLARLWTDNTGDSSGGGGYGKDSITDKMMGKRTSMTISKDVSDLTRTEKGVVSSAFAKAHEGAEIVEIRSISPRYMLLLIRHLNYPKGFRS